MDFFESCQLYIIARYKANDFSKIRPAAKPFFLQVYEIKKISIPVVFY